MFAAADDQAKLLGLMRCFVELVGEQHFSGFHLSLNVRTAFPKSYLAFILHCLVRRIWMKR
jgi:hypothetical protein